MSKLYIKKDGENFRVFEDDQFIGFAEAKNYSKDKRYGIIYKLPNNSLGREWVAAGKMADGLELSEHIEKSTGTTIKDNYAIFDKIKDSISPDDIAILDGLKEKYLKLAKAAELERQIAVLQKMREELGL